MPLVAGAIAALDAHSAQTCSRLAQERADQVEAHIDVIARDHDRSPGCDRLAQECGHRGVEHLAVEQRLHARCRLRPLDEQARGTIEDRGDPRAVGQVAFGEVARGCGAGGRDEASADKRDGGGARERPARLHIVAACHLDAVGGVDRDARNRAVAEQAGQRSKLKQFAEDRIAQAGITSTTRGGFETLIDAGVAGIAGMPGRRQVDAMLCDVRRDLREDGACFGAGFAHDCDRCTLGGCRASGRRRRTP